VLTFLALGSYGRFGNQLFQIASTIGIAIKSGQPFGFPAWINYDHRDRFGSSEDIDVQKYFVNPLPELLDVPYREQFIQWGYHNVYFPDGNWNLQGHMQSDKYFLHCIDTVRYYLKMKDELEENNCVAIHYRAGDYIDDQNAYHPRCSKEYYKEAMAMFPGAEFLIFSDNPKEAWEKISEFGKCRVAITANYLEDFKYMKSCKHFICANSSFSVMAAILANQEGKKVVCPKRWFGPVAGISGDDIYPQNSIVI
jgi:hypothetical protein